MIIGFAVLLIATAIALVLKGRPLGETLFLLGILVVVSFLIMVLVEGNARGIPKNEINVPWKLAVFFFLIAGALLVAGVNIGVT